MAFRAESTTPSPKGSGNEEFLKALQDVAAGLGVQASSSSYPGLVYMGSKNVRLPGREERGVVGRRDNWVTGEEAEAVYNTWSLKRRQDFIAQGKIAGLIDVDGGDMEGANLWRALVKEASYFGVKKKQRVSPLDILAGYVKGKGGGGAVWQRDPSNPDFEVNRLTGERRYVGPRFKTTTQKSLDFSDPATAAAVATRAFQDLMGRDPAKGELGAFAEALNVAEAQSPVVTTTTTEYDPMTGEPVSSSSTNTGGFDATAKSYLAEQRVKGTKEYGVVQAVTNYQNVLEGLIWGAPDMGGE